VNHLQLHPGLNSLFPFPDRGRSPLQLMVACTTVLLSKTAAESMLLPETAGRRVQRRQGNSPIAGACSSTCHPSVRRLKSHMAMAQCPRSGAASELRTRPLHPHRRPWPWRGRQQARPPPSVSRREETPRQEGGDGNVGPRVNL
jgi:hypothetical protein